MRQIVLDTETTGLEVGQGHRIIELGCVELVHRRPTGNTLHHYFNPGRAIDPGASEVHGIRNEHLVDKPGFAALAAELWRFLEGAELVIHNASFDVGFLDAEFALAGMTHPLAAVCRITDTLGLARSLHPGQKASLDALCRRYNVDNSSREFHGALLDARLLAEVYLAMTGGQSTLVLDVAERPQTGDAHWLQALMDEQHSAVIIFADENERGAHCARLVAIRGKAGALQWDSDLPDAQALSASAVMTSK